MLLNPDCQIIDKRSIKILIEALDKNKKIGVVGGRIFKNTKKNTQMTATNQISFLVGLFEFTNLKKLWINNPWSKNFWVENNRIEKPIYVTSLCGAFIMFRKKINNHFNLFNNKFFLYLEDIDFGIKNNKNNFKVLFVPQAKIIHHGGKSNKSVYHSDLRNWYKSRYYLFDIYLPKYQSIILHSIFFIEEKLLSLYHFLKNEPRY